MGSDKLEFIAEAINSNNEKLKMKNCGRALPLPDYI
jgi:hypothetical protein